MDKAININSVNVEPLVNKPILLRAGCHTMEGVYLGNGRLQTCWSKVCGTWDFLSDYDSWEYK